MMRKWRYLAQHLPTSKVFEQTTSAEYSTVEFLGLLDKWNRASDAWKYCSQKGEPVPYVSERVDT